MAFAPMNYADVFRPTARRQGLLYDAALILAGSWCVALSAQAAISLPFSPVPITGQTLAVLLVGALLGWRRGGLSILSYLGQGAAGLPVFANGTSGPAVLAGPTGGYLAGFIAAALLTGWLSDRGWDRRLFTAGLAMLIGNLALYLVALPWLALFVGLDRALPAGLYPFLSGDILKILMAAALLPAGWQVLRRLSPGD